MNWGKGEGVAWPLHCWRSEERQLRQEPSPDCGPGILDVEQSQSACTLLCTLPFLEMHPSLSLPLSPMDAGIRKCF